MTFDRANFDAIEALWKRFYPAKYAVDAAMIRQNTVESSVFDWGASQIWAKDGGEVQGFVLIKKSACPSLFKGPDPDQAHLSAIAFDEPALGVDLLAMAKRNLRNRGIYKLVFGQDSRHFFPGCPEECVPLRDFLQVEGFQETAECFDLEHDLSAYENPFPVSEQGVELRMLGDSDREALEHFLLREFPGRWTFDTMHKVEKEDRLDFVAGLFVEGSLEGFAVTQDASHRLHVCGATWRLDLGENWGTLGPIGVSVQVRGRKLGHGLLGFALSDLRRRSVRRCLIDWTTLDKFYGAHGFEVTRRYRGFSLRLDE